MLKVTERETGTSQGQVKVIVQQLDDVQPGRPSRPRKVTSRSTVTAPPCGQVSWTASPARCARNVPWLYRWRIERGLSVLCLLCVGV